VCTALGTTVTVVVTNLISLALRIKVVLAPDRVAVPPAVHRPTSGGAHRPFHCQPQLQLLSATSRWAPP
jgi:hypothetical protein